ncbi:MAG: tRNA dihydrouridine synthase DusB [Flavobacteriales bacterium]|nr:tRNA dihydrouridine synthase DusB [Flavobacteriales bacterium]
MSVKIDKINLGKNPILLAPMEDVSDPPFRRICKKHGADLMFTEFISSEGLIRDAEKSTKKLDIFEYERPIGIQIFGGNIKSMIESVRIINKVKPDIIDINYGCPVKKVVSKGAGAGILKDIDKMVAMTKAIVQESKFPVTIKTRLGWDNNSKYIVEVAEKLQDVGIKAISIHGRTSKQMYKGEADWDLIGKVKNNPRMKIPVFGNGDINSPEKAKLMFERYGVDGIMIGRASIGNPWVFKQIKYYLEKGENLKEVSLKEKTETCIDHLQESILWKGEKLGILEMRRHYSKYFKNIPHFKEYRMKLLQSLDIDEILYYLKEINMKFN